MALFNSSRQQSFSSPPRRQAEPIPSPIKNLQVDCHAHFGPVPMKHIGLGTSNQGQPMAIYACPVCNMRQGWVQDFRTGRARCLFTTPGE